MLPTELEVPTAEDIELVELARDVIDANTDARPDGAHTMPFAAAWTMEGGTQQFDEERFR